MLTGTYALLFLSLVMSCVAAVAAITAVRSSNRVDAVAGDLQASLRRLKAVQEGQTALEARFDRLAGRVYAQARKPRLPDDDLDESSVDPDLQAALALQTAPPVAPGRRQ